MTIRRQYSLPNCTLILDGLSDGNTNTGIPDPRPVMSSLFNAECHFVGCEQPLFGGRDFLTSLVATVSNYAQEFLSGVSHPAPEHITNSLVSLRKSDRANIHQLQATPDTSNEASHTGLLTDGKPTEIELSTVQLFDLVEAIDQFLADSRTLPDIMVPLRPVSKALAQPIGSQATPIGLGLVSLVVASLIGYALPSPQVSAPKFVNSAPPVVAPKTLPTTKPVRSPAAKETTKPDVQITPKPSASPSASPTSTLPAKTGKITEATQLGFLDRKLRRDLNQNWQERDRIKQETTFRVSMNQDGQIIGYQPAINTTEPQLGSLTPLPKLTIKSKNPNQAIGDFRVVFTPQGVLQVSPWEGYQGGVSLGKQIAEPELKTTLAQQLKTKLQQLSANPQFTPTQNINYRVGVTKTGVIADYEPENQAAYDYEIKTPLPQLAKFNPQAAIAQEALAHYLVVFQSNGQVKVTPH